MFCLGKRLAFYVSTPPVEFSNNRSVLEYPTSFTQLFVHSAIRSLSYSCRLIFDLRYINRHVFKQKFKFEEWRVRLDYSEKGIATA